MTRKKKLKEALTSLPNGRTPKKLRLACIVAGLYDSNLGYYVPSFEETERLEASFVGGAIIDTILTYVEITLDDKGRMRYSFTPNDNTFGSFITFTNG